jgi:hypothetical protein
VLAPEVTGAAADGEDTCSNACLSLIDIRGPPVPTTTTNIDDREYPGDRQGVNIP